MEDAEQQASVDVAATEGVAEAAAAEAPAAEASGMRARYKEKKAAAAAAAGEGDAAAQAPADTKFSTIRSSGFKKAADARNKMHEKVFRGWCNKMFAAKASDDAPARKLENLLDDFKSGVELIALVETLTEDTLSAKYQRAPKMDVQKIENVTLALTTLKNWVPSLDVESQSVVKGDAKAVLGMVWQLIVHFQILRGVGFEGDEAKAAKGAMMAKARQQVLDWWREQLAEYESVTIEDIETGFNDGVAILALLHKLDPSCVDFAQLDRSAAATRDNLTLAYRLAEEKLGVWPLLDADDVLNEDATLRPDEQCVLTYVSEFPPAFMSRFDAAAHAARAEAELERMRAAAEEALAFEREAAEAVKAAETAAVEAEAAEKEASALQQLEQMREEAAARVQALEAEVAETAGMSEAEVAQAKADKEAALAALAAERAALEEQWQAELARQEAAAADEMRRAEEKAAAEKADLDAALREAQAAIESYKQEGLSELEQLRRERDEIAAAVREEMERLRAENELLRRGVEHKMSRTTFLKPNWCSRCRSMIVGRAYRCDAKVDGTGAPCRYTACSKCVEARRVPANCLGAKLALNMSMGGVKRLLKSQAASGGGGDDEDADADDDDDDDDGAPSEAAAAALAAKRDGVMHVDVAKLVAGKSVREGTLSRKDLGSGRWHKQFAVLKAGLLLFYASEKSARKGAVKDMCFLYDSRLVSYTKEKKSRENAFGIEAKNSVVWLDAGKSNDELQAWLAAINQCVLRSANTAVNSEKRLAALFIESREKGSEVEKELKRMTMNSPRKETEKTTTTTAAATADEETVADEGEVEVKKEEAAATLSMVSPRGNEESVLEAIALSQSGKVVIE